MYAYLIHKDTAQDLCLKKQKKKKTNKVDITESVIGAADCYRGDSVKIIYWTQE